MTVKLTLCYIKLYDSPPKSSAGEDDEMAKLPASQKKKMRQKQRKAEARAKKAHAASAVLNFSENRTPDILTPYLDGIVSKLLVISHNGKQMVQEGALTALASVADSSQEHFRKYYDAVMPYLKAILVNANDKSNRMLRAKAMECISLVGMAVGKEKFRDDAKQEVDPCEDLTDDDIRTAIQNATGPRSALFLPEPLPIQVSVPIVTQISDQVYSPKFQCSHKI